jgi:hypothetical protein
MEGGGITVDGVDVSIYDGLPLTNDGMLFAMYTVEEVDGVTTTGGGKGNGIFCNNSGVCTGANRDEE